MVEQKDVRGGHVEQQARRGQFESLEEILAVSIETVFELKGHLGR